MARKDHNHRGGSLLEENRLTETAGVPLRVLWVIDGGRPDPVATAFARGADRAEVDLAVAFSGTNPGESALQDAGARPIELGKGGGGLFALYRALRRVLRSEQFDVVHAHGSEVVLPAIVACRRARVPIVASLVESATAVGGFRGSSLREWLMMELLRWPGATTLALSEQIRRTFFEKYPEAARRIEVVSPGVKAVTFERRNPERSIELRHKLGFPAEGPVLITVVPLIPSSGVDILLRALQTVLKTEPGARLVIAGEGPMREQWTRLAEHLKVSSAVHWAGGRDPSPLLAGADLFVLPSREERFPMSLLEAMATELPVIATEVGSVPDILNSPNVGVRVPAGDPAALSRAITRLLTDLVSRQAIGAAGRKRVLAEFQSQQWLPKITKLYRQAVGELTGKLKIAVVEFEGKGEPIQHAYQLCRAMAKEGADVTLLTESGYELERLEHSFRVRTIFQSPGGGGGKGRIKVPAALLRYRNWVRLFAQAGADRYDVVQIGEIGNPSDLLPLRLLRRRIRVLGHVVRDPRRLRASGMAARLHERMFGLFDRIFVQSEASRAAFASAFPASAGRAVVVASGTFDLFREVRAPLMTANRVRTELGFLPGDPVVLAFGTLAPGAGINLLIEAFAAVSLGNPRARLVITGPLEPGFDVPQHLALAVGLGAGDRVRIVDGHVAPEAVAAWMELASVAAFPDPESHETAALGVAQALGVPVIAARGGAMAETIQDGVTGILVEPKFADGLADAISHLLDEPEFARSVGEASRTEAGKREGWSGTAKAMLGAYERDFVRNRRRP